MSTIDAGVTELGLIWCGDASTIMNVLFSWQSDKLVERAIPNATVTTLVPSCLLLVLDLEVVASAPPKHWHSHLMDLPDLDRHRSLV